MKNPYAKQKRYRKANPDKSRAHNHISSLVQAGKIKPAKELKCAHCPDQARSYHHPNGYNGDGFEDVVPLCQKCHVEAHNKVEPIHYDGEYKWLRKLG